MQLSPVKVTTSTIVLLLNPHSTEPSGTGHIKQELSLNLHNTALTPPNSFTYLKPLSELIHTSFKPWPCTVKFPKISQKSTNSKQTSAGLRVPHTSFYNASNPELEEASLGSQHNHSQGPPIHPQTAINH